MNSRLLLLLAVLVLAAAPAHADSGPVGRDLQVAQSLGERELTVLIRRVDAAPGPVRIEVVTHAGSPAGTLDLRLAAAGTVTSRGRVALGVTPGLYGTTLEVDRSGSWELAVDDGERVARIPFVVPVKVIQPWESATYGGFATAGGLLLVALVLTVRSRRAWPPLVAAGGMVAALAVGITAALLSSSIPPPRDLTDTSRPPVNLAVHASEAIAGQRATLRLALTDGSTGRRVDDLLVHHNAFVHLVVVGPSGRLWHLHPARIAPGDFRVEFTPSQAGNHAVAAELARQGGGVQLVRSTVEVAGTGTADPEPPGLGPRTVDGAAVELSATTVGTSTTITARIGTRADLQPWLGMLGHLIVVGPGPTPTWAHVHAMAPVSNTVQNGPDETVAAFGPDVRFTYTFPAPGRYRLWIQAERGFAVLTIPAVFDVPAKESQ